MTSVFTDGETSFAKVLRVIYVAIALSTALAIHLIVIPVSAQDVLKPYKEQNQLYDRLDKQDAHIGQLDTKFEDLSTQVTYMRGIAEGGMIGLGILQAVGLITKFSDKKAGQA